MILPILFTTLLASATADLKYADLRTSRLTMLPTVGEAKIVAGQNGVTYVGDTSDANAVTKTIVFRCAQGYIGALTGSDAIIPMVNDQITYPTVNGLKAICWNANGANGLSSQFYAGSTVPNSNYAKFGFSSTSNQLGLKVRKNSANNRIVGLEFSSSSSGPSTFYFENSVQSTDVPSHQIGHPNWSIPADQPVGVQVIHPIGQWRCLQVSFVNPKQNGNPINKWYLSDIQLLSCN